VRANHPFRIWKGALTGLHPCAAERAGSRRAQFASSSRMANYPVISGAAVGFGRQQQVGRGATTARLRRNSAGGQAVCCDTTRLAREALRPPVASLPKDGAAPTRAASAKSGTAALRAAASMANSLRISRGSRPSLTTVRL